MRGQLPRGVVVGLAAIGLLFYGKTATATTHLFERMGMATLPATPAPDFTLPDLVGTPVSLQGYRGKLVLLNFWATWCIPCREEMPAMEQLHRRFQAQGLAILAIDFRENAATVTAFVDQHHLTFTVLRDQDGSVFRAYSVMGLPTTYLIGRDGTLLARGVGGRDWTRAEGQALIHELLTQGPTALTPERPIDQGH
jgi:peroxiredoxin